MATELLRRDIHPAEVLLPNGRLLREARAFVTDRRLLVYRVERGSIERVLELDLVTEGPPASRGSLNGGNLELACLVPYSGRVDGATMLKANANADETAEATVFVNQGGGCGCGSPLKAMAPPIGWTR